MLSPRREEAGTALQGGVPTNQGQPLADYECGGSALWVATPDRPVCLCRAICRDDRGRECRPPAGSVGLLSDACDVGHGHHICCGDSGNGRSRAVCQRPDGGGRPAARDPPASSRSTLWRGGSRRSVDVAARTNPGRPGRPGRAGCPRRPRPRHPGRLNHPGRRRQGGVDAAGIAATAALQRADVCDGPRWSDGAPPHAGVSRRGRHCLSADDGAGPGCSGSDALLRGADGRNGATADACARGVPWLRPRAHGGRRYATL